MKYIGRGWQYTVYDIGEGRVLKRYNSLFEAYVEMLKEQLLAGRFPVWDFAKHYIQTKKLASISLRKVVECSLDQSLFGNPKIVGELEYEQDVTKSLSDFFERHDEDESKKKIDELVKFCLLLKENFLIEKNFNMADNFGVNNKDEIVLIDLGEVCWLKEEIDKQIKRRVWVKGDVLSKIPLRLREYFVRRMDEAFGV